MRLGRFGELDKNKITMIIVGIAVIFVFLINSHKGSPEIDENGYIQSSLQGLWYKYNATWDRIPTDINTTLYVKDENGNNELLITLYAYPLAIADALSDDPYGDIEKLYTDVYDTTEIEQTELDGLRADKFHFFYDEEKFGGDIYIVVDGKVGYTIMFTEPMDTMSSLTKTQITNQFLSDIEFR